MANTLTISPSVSSFRLTSTRNYAGSITSGGYTWTLKSGPSSAYKDITFNLSSIPAGKGIASATLTWSISTWADSGIDSGYGSGYASVFPGAQSSQFGVSAAQGSTSMTTKVEDALSSGTFTVRFYYKPHAPSVYYDTDNTHYGYNSCSAYADFSNISLSVAYTDISNNPPSILVGVSGVAKEVKEWYVGVGGVAKKVVEAYIGDDSGKARKIYPGLNASYLRVGDTVLINEKGTGTAEWIVMGQGHYSSSTVALMRKKLITTGKYSSKDTSSSTNRYYVNETLDTYLNTEWYNALQSSFRSKLVSTTINCQPVSSGAADVQVARYVWAPALCEVMTGVTGAISSEGTIFPYFSEYATSVSDRIAYREDTGAAWMWYTRSVITGMTGYVAGIANNGNKTNTSSSPSGSSNFGGYRPVICISKTASVIQNSSSNYTLQL